MVGRMGRSLVRALVRWMGLVVRTTTVLMITGAVTVGAFIAVVVITEGTFSLEDLERFFDDILGNNAPKAAGSSGPSP